MVVKELFKYDMVYIFHSIKHVYGEALFEKFVSYLKKTYYLDPSYDYCGVIDAMYEDEIVFSISIFFDSENIQHIYEIGIKDEGLENLISYLKENFPLAKNCITYQLESYNNPKTKQEHINELHHILVQTCLNYMKEHELTDIDEIQFSASGLSSSYEYGEWTPATDSYLSVIGLQIEEDGKFNLPVRRIIGESM